MTHEDIEASKAPLLDHLIELRQRLMRALIAIFIAFLVCFYFASDIFNILIVPYEKAAGPLREIKLIYTAPQEYFFTQMKLALFGALFIAFLQVRRAGPLSQRASGLPAVPHRDPHPLRDRGDARLFHGDAARDDVLSVDGAAWRPGQRLYRASAEGE
jgi:hypothetical protein